MLLVGQRVAELRGSVRVGVHSERVDATDAERSDADVSARVADARLLLGSQTGRQHHPAHAVKPGALVERHHPGCLTATV